MSLTIRVTTRFQRDIKKMARRHKELTKLEAVITRLVSGEPLPTRYRNHALTGELHGWRDIHVEPDWLLIDRIDLTTQELILLRTGTHADIFEESRVRTTEHTMTSVLMRAVRVSPLAAATKPARRLPGRPLSRPI